jgi:hypothetical protein
MQLPSSTEFRTNFHAYSQHYGLRWLKPWVLRALRRFHAQAHCSFVPTSAVANWLSV